MDSFCLIQAEFTPSHPYATDGLSRRSFFTIFVSSVVAPMMITSCQVGLEGKSPFLQLPPHHSSKRQVWKHSLMETIPTNWVFMVNTSPHRSPWSFHTSYLHENWDYCNMQSWIGITIVPKSPFSWLSECIVTSTIWFVHPQNHNQTETLLHYFSLWSLVTRS